jgi:hypothetical protein
MGDFQFWLYVIIGIIYLISRMRKKSQAEESDAPSQEQERRSRRAEETRHSESRPVERQLTFEDLLREITEGKVATPKTRTPEPEIERPSYYRNYDEEIEDEVKEVVEDVNYDYRTKDSLYSQYEQAKNEAFTRPSLGETMNVSDTDMRFGKFKEFEIKNQRNLANEYLADLRDPEGLKKAFVLSEILKRKF